MCPFLPMMSLTRFRRMYPAMFGAEEPSGPVAKSMPAHIKVDISARHDKALVRWNRLLCAATDQAERDGFSPSFRAGGGGAGSSTLFFHERFVYIWTNQYFLPIFFANPHHADAMHRLFPQGLVGAQGRAGDGSEGSSSSVYNLLVKLLVIPGRRVMTSVASFAQANAAVRIGRHVSLQVRAFQLHVMEQMAMGFDACLQKHVGQTQHGSSNEAVDHGTKRQAVSRLLLPSPVFLASMHVPVRQYFARTYTDGFVRALAPPTGEQGTGRGPSLDQDALADLVLLSLSAHVFISPGSTFGSFVGAFGDITPRVVRWYLRGDAAVAQKSSGAAFDAMCPRVPSTQPCFGAWFKYDHLFQKSSLGSNATNRFSCALRALPDDVMHCSKT
jgi:hypothetical protein